MPSADSCRHIPAPHDASSTTAHRQASPGNAHSPSRLCPPHIRPCFPCKNRTSEIFASSSSMTASNAIPVRQASALPSASFRFHLTMNTLAVQLALPLAGPAEDFHLQVSAPCRAHKKEQDSHIRLSCSVFDDPLMIQLWNLHRLLRKEVIQPHLPVQLPCYDLTPVISHTLNTRLINEATRLRVQPTPMV